MDWNLKAAWDLTGFEQDGMSHIDGLGRPNNFRVNKASGDFSIDLKLGGVGNSFHESMNKWKQPGILKPDSSPSGSMKRSRASNNGSNAASCLVDGCNSDLSNCREYHRRHKVCEIHSKTPQVTIRGQKQRFCQQCSRFHSLEEFDEGKRSCRKRLDGHNRRRRKPQPDPMCRRGSFLPNFRGSQLLQFSGSHAHPSTTIVNPAWSAIVGSQANARCFNLYHQANLLDKHSLFLGSSLESSYKEEKQFPFLQGDNPMLNGQTSTEACVCQPLLRNISMSETTGGRHSMFCDRLPAGVPDSDCALSLLSSMQMQTHTQTSGNPMLQTNSVPLVQSLDPPLPDQNLGAIDSVLVSNGRASNIPCPVMFQMQSGGSSGYKAPQTLPFSWE